MLSNQYSEQLNYSFKGKPSGVTLPFGAPLLIFCRPHKFFYCLQKKKKKKKKKKGRHFFFGFCTPKYFFRVDRTLSWPRYGTFSYFVKTFFVLKTVSLVICRPPKVPPPCIAGVAGAVVTPLGKPEQ